MLGSAKEGRGEKVAGIPGRLRRGGEVGRVSPSRWRGRAGAEMGRAGAPPDFQMYQELTRR